MSRAGNTYPCAFDLNGELVKVRKQKSGSNVRWSLTYYPESMLEWAPISSLQEDTVEYYLGCYRLGKDKEPEYLERNLKEYCDKCSNKPDMEDMEQKDWCLGFRVVCRITAKGIKRRSVCQQVGKPDCRECKKRAGKDKREIRVYDIRFRGHPTQVILHYSPVDCKWYREAINKHLSGVNGVNRGACRFSTRLVKAVNSVFAKDMAEIAHCKCSYLSEALDIPRDTLKRWRYAEERKALTAYKTAAAVQRLHTDDRMQRAEGRGAATFVFSKTMPARTIALLYVHESRHWQLMHDIIYTPLEYTPRTLQCRPIDCFNLAFDYFVHSGCLYPAECALFFVRFRYSSLKMPSALSLVLNRLDEEERKYYHEAVAFLLREWKELIHTAIQPLSPWEAAAAVIRSMFDWGENDEDCRLYHRISFLRGKHGLNEESDFSMDLDTEAMELCDLLDRRLTQSDVARLLAFNAYALSGDPAPGDREDKDGRMIQRDAQSGFFFDASGEFIYTLAHLRKHGGMPIQPLKTLLDHGLLAREEDDEPGLPSEQYR